MLYTVVGEVVSHRRIVPVPILQWHDISLLVNTNGMAHVHSYLASATQVGNVQFYVRINTDLSPTWGMTQGSVPSSYTAECSLYWYVYLRICAQGSNPGGGKVFCTRPDRFSGPTSLLYNGCRSLPVIRRQGRGVDHPRTSSSEVKERVQLYIDFPCRPSWPVLGRILPLSDVSVYIQYSQKDKRSVNDVPRGTPRHCPIKHLPKVWRSKVSVPTVTFFSFYFTFPRPSPPTHTRNKEFNSLPEDTPWPSQLRLSLLDLRHSVTMQMAIKCRRNTFLDSILKKKAYTFIERW